MMSNVEIAQLYVTAFAVGLAIGLLVHMSRIPR